MLSSSVLSCLRRIEPTTPPATPAAEETTFTEVSRGAIFEQEQIARAVELGLGVKSPDQIRLVTDDAGSEDFVRRLEPVLTQG